MMNLVAGAILIVGVLVHILIWRHWGRQTFKAQNVGRYWYDVPDEPPATVAVLLGKGDGFAPTVVDLAQRGYLNIRELPPRRTKLLRRKRNWQFTQMRAVDNSLLSFEARLLRYLFQHGSEISQRDLSKRAKQERDQAEALHSGFHREVRETIRAYDETNRTTALSLNAATAGVMMLGACVCIIGGSLLALVTVLGAVVVGMLSINLKRRTPEGVQRAAEWTSLRRYLRDFGNFKDAPAGHLILWERYLVYAVALGVARQLGKGLAQRLPESSLSSGDFATWYTPSVDAFDLVHLASFSKGFAGDLVPSGFGFGSFNLFEDWFPW